MSSKTGGEIEQDVFNIIKSSPIKDAITGGVYLPDTRPKNPTGVEDVVVKFLSGLDGQFQSGVVNINIYVPDIDNGGDVLVVDKGRCTELEIMLKNVLESLIPSNYLFSKDGTIQTFKAEGVDEHFVNARLKYKLKTF